MSVFRFHYACFFLLSGLLYAPIAQASTPPRGCEVVGRVLESSNFKLKPGDQICQNQVITSPARIKVACLAVRRVLWVEDVQDLNQCQQPLPPVRHCAIKPGVKCDPMRTEVSMNKPTLLRPYGITLLSAPSQIAWAPVTGAERYVITILGKRTSQLSSTEPQLNLPKLPESNTLQFVVEAFAQDRLLGSSITTFNLLSGAQAKQVNADLALIDQLQISPEEKTSLRLAIFAEAGLLDNAIVLAEKQAQAQPNNPVALRQLGDLMLDAGWLENANVAYQKARAIAIKINNPVEIERSESGLRFIRTSTKN
jgi:environmental stress-induced protein Ves